MSLKELPKNKKKERKQNLEVTTFLLSILRHTFKSLCVYVYVYVYAHSIVSWLFTIPWTVACQSPLSMGFSGQECWSGLPFSSLVALPHPGIGPKSLASSALAGRFFTTSHLKKWKWSQSCQTLCNPMDCSPPGLSFHGILQVRILEWIAFPFSRGSSQSRDGTQVSRIAGWFFTSCTTREALGN